MNRKTQLTVLVLALVATSVWAQWTPVMQINIAEFIVDIGGLGTDPTDSAAAAADAEANAMAALHRDYIVLEILASGPAPVFPGGSNCDFLETKWVCGHGITARVLAKTTIFTFP